MGTCGFGPAAAHGRLLPEGQNESLIFRPLRGKIIVGEFVQKSPFFQAIKPDSQWKKPNLALRAGGTAGAKAEMEPYGD